MSTVAAHASRHRAIRRTYWHLRFLGFDRVEAGNLVALVHELPPVRDGWSVDELERLLFTRHLVRAHLLLP